MIYAAKNQAEARRTIVSYTKIDKGVADGMLLPYWSARINEASARYVVGLGIKYGVLDKTADVATLFGPTRPL